METELRKLPKDMLIEIIKKGFDLKSLPPSELKKIFHESKQMLKDNLVKEVKNDSLLLWEDVKMEIDYIHFDICINSAVKIQMIGKMIYCDSIHPYDKYNFKNFNDMLDKIKDIITRELRIKYKNADYKLNESIEWNLLKEIYDRMELWAQVVV